MMASLTDGYSVSRVSGLSSIVLGSRVRYNLESIIIHTRLFNRR